MALALITSGTASADTITVNNSTGQVADFISIQAAIYDINTTDGDTILVYPGTYVENVDINKKLTIIAESGPDVTTVQGVPGMDDYVFHAGNLSENVNVTINGFNVTGGRGIGFSESLHSELRNNIISDGGIFAAGSDITVINNTVISKGITLYDSQGVLENNEVFSCPGTGITIEAQADGTFFNNTIYGNGVGIRIWDFGSGNIYNNTIYGNEVGIEIYRNSFGKVANNYFNNTMNAQINEPYIGIFITWNITKTAGTNIIEGPYLGGNYWAHPNGTGFSQTHGGVDGICDLPYIIDENNIDHLPLTYLTSPRVHNIDSDKYFYGIQDAIDDLETVDEHTIVVNNGTYVENVDVYKELTIISQSGNPVDTIIQAVNPNDYVFYVIADNVIISGFNVTGATDGTGLGLDGVEGCTIAENSLSNSDSGILMMNSSSNTLSSNSVLNNSGYGIYLEDSNNSLLYNNYFNNTNNVEFTGTNTGNTWNITLNVGTNIVGGPFVGGNYWLHPNGTGFSVDTADFNKDGICDEQYNLSETEVDYLPLTIVIDDLMPVISISSPADGTSTTASSIAVSGLVNGTGSLPVVIVNDIVAETTILDFNGTFTATVPLVIGANTIYANVTDAAGNTNTTSVNVTRTSPSSGGGGGGATGEAFENILVKDAATSNVVAGELSRYEFSEEKCHIVYIQFKGVANAGLISTLIEILKDTSTLVDSPAPGIVYQNMNIWVGNVAFGDDKIEDAVIGFRVSKEWLSENGIDASSIALYRYSDGKWNQLSTINVDEDGEYIYFEAETPGFSPFAVAGFAEEGESISIEDSTPLSEEDISAAEDEDTLPESRGILWISTGSLILILVGVHLLMRKRG